ncbi:MAG: InlB B-repeat-containing protein, partial [Oscillospiraceae bacterium]
MKKILCAVMAGVTALTSIAVTIPAAAAEYSYNELEYQINGSEITITKYTGNDSEVYIPDSIDGRKVVEIGMYAFSGKEEIEHIRFSAYLRRINEKAFLNCSSLQEVVLPATMTKIDSCAFQNCTDISDVVFGSDVELAYAVFENCDYIENVTLYPGEKYKYEGYRPSSAFVNCSGISNAYYFGDNTVENKYDNFTHLFINQKGIYTISVMDTVNYYALQAVADNVSVFNPKSTHSTVTFNTNGGSGETKLYALKGQMVSEPMPPVKTDCDFLGWYKNPECTGEPWDFVFDKVYEDTTLYAKWCPKQYTLTFDSTGGTSADPIDVSFGTAIGEMPTPTKSGYQFAGWYTRENGSGDLYTPDNIMPKSDIKLYAAWIQNGKSLVVDFDLNGGKGTVEKCLVGYNETIDSFPSVNRTGYTFVEWNSKPDGTGAHITKKTKIIYNNLKVYAVWEPNPCTVTLNANKGTVSKDKITVKYETKIGALETPVRDAYEFLGWYYADGTKCSPDDIVTNNIKLTAKWRGYEYMILLNPKGGKMTEDDTKYVCCGDSVGELP